MLRSQKKNWESQAGSIELSKKRYATTAARRWRRSQHNDGYDGKGSTLLGKATHWRGPSAALSTVLLCSAIAECVSVCKKWTNSSWLSLPLLQPPTPSDGYSHCVISILDTSLTRMNMLFIPTLPVKVEFTAILSNAKNAKQGLGGSENLLKS